MAIDIPQYDIIVCGGGPTGMFVACRLIGIGLRVLVLEKDKVSESAIRAMGYYGATQYALRNAGIFEKCKARGFFQTEFSWRKMTRKVSEDENAWGELIARWNPWEHSDIELGQCGAGMLIMGQDALRDICKAQVEQSPLGDILMGHPVEGLEQTESGAKVIATDSSTGERREFAASFVIGADGGRSRVRGLIGQHLEGWTWPQTVVGSDIRVKLDAPPDGPVLAYLINQETSCFFCPLERVRPDARTLYRFTVLMQPEDCEPAVFDERFRKQLEDSLPGKKPSEYEIVRVAPYTTHQRQVGDYMVGRTLLIGDAAHLNTPTGGLGLTTGLLDADALADAFDMHMNGGRPMSVLRTWASARHDVWRDLVNPMSQQNHQRFLYADPENPKTDPFLKMVIEQGDGLEEVNKSFDRDFVTRMHELCA